MMGTTWLLLAFALAALVYLGLLLLTDRGTSAGQLAAQHNCGSAALDGRPHELGAPGCIGKGAPDCGCSGDDCEPGRAPGNVCPREG